MTNRLENSHWLFLIANFVGYKISIENKIFNSIKKAKIIFKVKYSIFSQYWRDTRLVEKFVIFL